MIVALLIACSGPVQDYCDRNTLTLIGADGSTVEPLAQSSQIGVSEPIISQDGSAAGWLSNEPFCCTSYPISVHLVIYTSTKLLKAFTGDGRAIFKWKFVSSGRRVAFYQDFPHGTPVQHYELRDVYSSRLISKWNGELTRKGAGLDKRTLIVLVSNYLANRVVLDQPNDARFANLQRV